MGDGKGESIRILRFLKTDPKARYQGYSFYFREGFCWNLINGTRSSNDLKFRMSPCGVNDVGAMTLHLIEHNLLSNSLILAITNSPLISKYTEAYVNFTVNFQVNDCRQIPIVIPTKDQLETINSLVMNAIDLKKYNQTLQDGLRAIEDLVNIETQLNGLIKSLYGI